MEKLAICNKSISQSKPDLRFTIEHVNARAYIYICTCTCIRVSLHLFTRKNANAVSYVRLRACLRAALIKTQNVFARKIFQHSNALWVQKLSGCTIVIHVSARESGPSSGVRTERKEMSVCLCSRPNPNKGGREPAISAYCWADYTQGAAGCNDGHVPYYHRQPIFIEQSEAIMAGPREATHLPTWQYFLSIFFKH